MIKKTVFTILISFVFINLLSSQEITEFHNAIKEAKNQHDTLQLSREWYKLGKYLDENHQLSESNNAIRKALKFAQAISNKKAVSVTANYLAANLSFQGNSDSAVYYYNVARNASIENSDSTRLALISLNLGDEYASRGNFIEAAKHTLSAIRIKELMNDSSDLAYFYQKTGEVYKLAGENKNWEKYIKTAYQLCQNENYTNLKATAAVYNDMGGIAEKHGNYIQALLYYDTLKSIGIKNNYQNAIHVALSNSATIYKLQGHTDKALDTVLKAQNFEFQNVYHQVYNNNLLTELYQEKNNYKKAFTHAQIAVSHKNIDTYPEEKMRALKNLYLIEKHSGNFDEALSWHEKYKVLSDSIRNKEVMTSILDLDVAYQTEKKERQIEQLTYENELKKQRLNAGVILLAVLVFIIFLILYILRIRKQKAKLIQNHLQQQVLQAQMNPHFIFNVMGSIQNYMQSNDTVNAARYLAKFSSLMRSTLEHLSKNAISLSEEIIMLTNYMEIESMRLAHNFDYKIEINDEMETDLIFIPPMLVQPFIENAVKHGFRNLNHPGLLLLKITEKENAIEFIIEDNGNGLDKTKQVQGHQSMATSIFEKRRKLIQQKYRRDFNFEMINLNDINKEKTGVRIIINIPVLRND